MEIETMLKNENKTKTCDNDQVEITNDRVCVYDIQYTIYTCVWLTKDVSFTMFD